jgi:3-dehydroquinate synthase class II
MSLDHEKLAAVAQQMMTGSVVGATGKTVKVERTGSQKLRTVRFEVDGREYQMIEQNPEKPSRWGKLAREGHRVVQVRDVELGKYVAAVVDGKVREYGKLKGRGGE